MLGPAIPDFFNDWESGRNWCECLVGSLTFHVREFGDVRKSDQGRNFDGTSVTRCVRGYIPMSYPQLENASHIVAITTTTGMFVTHVVE